MEKVIYVVWAPSEHREAVTAELAGPVGRKLLELGTRGLQVNLADGDVTRPTFAPPPEPGVAEMVGLVELWLHSARDGARRPYDDVIAGVGAGSGTGADTGVRWAGYLVTESEPIVSDDPPSVRHRMEGFAQFVLLRIPTGLSRAEWLERWQGEHTQVAIDTQSTFRYVQNIVARSFGPAPDPGGEVAAVVEECFPIGAMTDPAVFYDSVGDDERLARHTTAMMESVGRFMEEGAPPMVWTSEYVFRHRQ